MTKLLSPKLALLTIFVLACFGTITAQNVAPADGTKPPNTGAPPKRPNLLLLLGLSQEQTQQIRRMNQARKPLMEAAARRLGDANKAMDEAIYTDNFDESVFRTRLTELQQ